MKKFNSKDEARNFILSEEYFNYLANLSADIAGLIEQSKTEQLMTFNHGNNYFKPSDYAIGYVQSEVDRIKNLYDYFTNLEVKSGYIWVYNEERHEADQIVDISNLSKMHPVFLEYIKENNIKECDIDEAYIIWKNYNLNPTLNNIFKYVYNFKIRDLIPSDMKIF